MYDTLMQMGRWFGYRTGYEDLIRVYTTERCFYDGLYILAKVEKEVRVDIIATNFLGKHLLELAVEFTLHNEMKPTSSRKNETRNYNHCGLPYVVFRVSGYPLTSRKNYNIT